MRGDVHGLRAPRGARGHEQQGSRFALVGQSDDLLLTTVLVAPTSRSAQLWVFRPMIVVEGDDAHVLVEQTAAVAPERLGELVGHLSGIELEDVDRALRLAFQLD